MTRSYLGGDRFVVLMTEIVQGKSGLMFNISCLIVAGQLTLSSRSFILKRHFNMMSYNATLI